MLVDNRFLQFWLLLINRDPVYFFLHHVVTFGIYFGFEGDLRPQALILLFSFLFYIFIPLFAPLLLVLKVVLLGADISYSFSDYLSPALHVPYLFLLLLFLLLLELTLPLLYLPLLLCQNIGVSLVNRRVMV